MQVSRRTALALGGSLVALLSGAAIWKTQSTRGTSTPHGSPRAMERVVDHKGWMLTAADQKKLLEQPAAPAVPSSNADADTEAP
jgi:hypothetical protein